MKAKKKPVEIEAITFDELVAHARAAPDVNYAPANGENGNLNSMPWSFSYKGHQITHENDDCYLIPTLEGSLRMTRDDLLITGVKGEIYPIKRTIFDETYDVVQNVDSVSDARTVNNAFRHQYRVLGDGEKALMTALKDKGAEMADLIDQVKRTNANAGRATAIALTKTEEAVMWAVKGLTG